MFIPQFTIFAQPRFLTTQVEATLHMHMRWQISVPIHQESAQKSQQAQSSPAVLTAVKTARRLADLVRYHFDTFLPLYKQREDSADNYIYDQLIFWKKVSYDFWRGVFHFIVQIPTIDPRLDELIRIVLALREVEDPTGAPPEFWKSLYGLTEIFDLWELELPLARPNDQEHIQAVFKRLCGPEGPSQARCRPVGGVSENMWPRINGFLARIVAKIGNIQPFKSLYLKGMYAMIEALEVEHKPGERDICIQAATQWMLQAGYTLSSVDANVLPLTHLQDCDQSSENCRCTIDIREKRDPWANGEHYSGPPGINRRRWQFWHYRLEQLSDPDNYQFTLPCKPTTMELVCVMRNCLEDLIIDNYAKLAINLGFEDLEENYKSLPMPEKNAHGKAPQRRKQELKEVWRARVYRTQIASRFMNGRIEPCYDGEDLSM
jgi:hypothetical protein